MIECQTLAEAREVPGVIHIECGEKFTAFLPGDTLPSYCKVEDPGVAEEGPIA